MPKTIIFATRKSIKFDFKWTSGEQKSFTFTAPSTAQIKKQIKAEEKIKKTSALLSFKEKSIKEAISGDDKDRMFDELMEHGNIYDFGLELTKLLENEKEKK